jgi:hypothetical protein
MLLLTSCGKNVEGNNIENSVSNNGVQEEQPNEVEVDPYNKVDIIDITLIGDDKAEVSIESKELISIMQSEKSECSIYLSLFKGEDCNSGIQIIPDGWVYFISAVGQTDEEYYDFDDPFSVNGDVLTFTMNVEGIKSNLEEYDSFYFDIYDNDSEEVILYATGPLDEIIAMEASDCIVDVSIINEDECIITLSGTILDAYGDSNDYQELRILFSPEELAGFLYTYKVSLSFYTDDIVGCEVYEFENIAETISETETNYESNFVASTPGEIKFDGSRYQIIIEHEGIGNGIMDSGQIVVEDGVTDSTLYSVSRDSAVLKASEIEYNIPTVFTASNLDQEYFSPSTDSFVIAMYEFPAQPIFEYGIGYPYGKSQPVYMPVYATEEPVTYITLTSYSAGEVIDERTKIIYQSVKSMQLNACTRLDWCDASEFNEDPDHDQVLIDDYMLYVDELAFGEPRDESNTDYEYFGFDENVRYFQTDLADLFMPYILLEETLEINGADDFDESGFSYFNLTYSEDFPDFDQGYSVGRNYEVAVTVWASEAFRGK